MTFTLLAISIALGFLLWWERSLTRKLEHAAFELVTINRRMIECYKVGDLRIDSGYCMCGAKIEPGRSCDNHSPVDSGEYYGAPLFKELERRAAALDSARPSRDL